MREKGYRQTRMQELIFEEVASIVPLEMQDPRVMNCRVTRVELSGDFKSCRVLFVDPGAPDGGKGSEAALNHAAAFVAARVLEYLPMKGTPKFHFVYDHATEEAERLEALFEKIAHPHPDEGPEPDHSGS
ncbi:MAG: 30S ribosome-binding factor RbfA [Acidobacteria bacterium]|nr:30S ribosome-binding factor RbfA [Acidobacteriota bacterium]